MKLIRYSTDYSFSSHVSAYYKTLLMIALFITIILHTVINAAAIGDDETGKQQLPDENQKSTNFEYQLENRADPFVPFISEKAQTASVNMDEIVDSNEPLTGMQLFEPGQLTLVAIVKKGSENLAMVQDFTGKGYVLTEGLKIGRRGIVKSLSPQSVIVEETTVTRAGKKTVTEVVMLLKKEGEK
jgi:hypothetical protein